MPYGICLLAQNARRSSSSAWQDRSVSGIWCGLQDKRKSECMYASVGCYAQSRHYAGETICRVLPSCFPRGLCTMMQAEQCAFLVFLSGASLIGPKGHARRRRLHRKFKCAKANSTLDDAAMTRWNKLFPRMYPPAGVLLDQVSKTKT